jgi:hypothetical protein
MRHSTERSPPETRLSTPTTRSAYLSRLKAPRALARAGASDVTVRVVEYHLRDDDEGNVTETFALITTLLEPTAAPARELAELYHDRWQIETAIGAFKSQLKGDGVVLRSKTPDGAEQELWALLCAYHAIRDLICAAAALAEKDPLRISFVNALDAVRGPVGDSAAFPLRRTIDDVLRGWLLAIGSVTNPDRRDRSNPGSNPRQAKRSLSRQARRPSQTPQRRGPLTLVMLPLALEGDP